MPLATIEKLPVELLEPIFTHSDNNVALVVASQLIGAKLSSKHIYDATCNTYLTQVFDSRAEQAKLQTVIFASRWMTWSSFQSWVLRRYESMGCLCGREGCFDAQWPPDFEDATKMVYTRSHLPELAFVRGRIPKKLLQGPWNQDNVRFLRFLLWTTAMTVDWKDAEIRQAAIAGRKRAMKDRNLEAVELFNHNRRLGKVADMDTVRYAVMECGCDRSIVYDTLLTSATLGRERTYDCKELDEWCAKREQNNEPKGLWLRSILNESRLLYQSCARKSLSSVDGVHAGVAADELVILPSRWNKPLTQLGWSYHPTPTSAKVSLHNTRRDEQGDFWSYTRGYHQHIRGEGSHHSFWLDMWIPDRLNVEDMWSYRSEYSNIL